MGRKLVTWGALLMAIGILPIGLYSVFGPADGNPIGLGLLMVVLVPVGFLLLGTGLLKLLLARMQRHD
jgi:dipeptide/tripeptide permease